MTDVAVVVPVYGNGPLVQACLEALDRSAARPAEIVVVDDASVDDAAAPGRDRAGVTLITHEENRGFAASCNHGIAATRAPYVLLLNSDARVAPETLSSLAQFLDAHDTHAAVAPRLLNPDGTTQHACMAFPRLRTALWFGTPLERWRPDARELRRYFLRDFDHESERDVVQPPASCLLLRRSALDEVGSFDESLQVYFNDVDLSLRLHLAGWRTRYLAGVVCSHEQGASTELLPRRLLRWHVDRLAYYRKHHGVLAGFWVKACVTWTFLDHALRRLGCRVLRRKDRAPELSGPFGPVVRDYFEFLDG